MDVVTHKKIIELVIATGQEALHLRKNGLDVEYKKDGSPVTNVDIAAHHMILEELSKISPGIEIISEEGEKPRADGKYSHAWLTDPIDGTSSLVDGKPEFSVLLGLVENGVPTQGFAYYPDPHYGTLYYTGADDNRAYKQTVAIESGEPVFGQAIELKTMPLSGTPKVTEFIVTASDFLNSEYQLMRDDDYASPLSSLAVVEGQTDLAFVGPDTLGDWDLVAIDAIARNSGTVFVSTVDKKPLVYGEERAPNKAYQLGPYVAGNAETLQKLGLLSQDIDRSHEL